MKVDAKGPDAMKRKRSPSRRLYDSGAQWVRQYGADYAAWFRLAQDFSDYGAELAGRLPSPLTADVRASLCCLLFLRGLSAYEGAIIMARRGMTTETLTLTRSCFEAIFYFGATVNDEKFHEKLESDDLSRRKKLAGILIGLEPEDSGLSDADHDFLSGWIADLPNLGKPIKAIPIDQIAVLADLKSIYDTFYRSLSNAAIHPSATALQRHARVDGSNNLLGWRIEATRQEFALTLTSLCAAGWHLLESAMTFFTNDAPLEGWTDCRVTYLDLMNRAGMSN